MSEILCEPVVAFHYVDGPLWPMSRLSASGSPINNHTQARLADFVKGSLFINRFSVSQF